MVPKKQLLPGMQGSHLWGPDYPEGPRRSSYVHWPCQRNGESELVTECLSMPGPVLHSTCYSQQLYSVSSGHSTEARVSAARVCTEPEVILILFQNWAFLWSCLHSHHNLKTGFHAPQADSFEFITQQRINLVFKSSCLHLMNTGIIYTPHHAWLMWFQGLYLGFHTC